MARFVSFTTGVKIQHAENEGEFAITDTQLHKTYYVDGKALGKNIVYEFYG